MNRSSRSRANTAWASWTPARTQRPFGCRTERAAWFWLMKKTLIVMQTHNLLLVPTRASCARAVGTALR